MEVLRPPLKLPSLAYTCISELTSAAPGIYGGLGNISLCKTGKEWISLIVPNCSLLYQSAHYCSNIANHI